MQMKRDNEHIPWVEPPNHSWVYDRMKAHGNLKIRVPEQIENERDAACTTGKIRAWFESMEKDLNPGM
jgi:hypothetical protein